MVQMKGIGKLAFYYQTSYFISHMVQMKVTKGDEDCRFILYLYIPHGSDESFAVFFVCFGFL